MVESTASDVYSSYGKLSCNGRQEIHLSGDPNGKMPRSSVHAKPREEFQQVAQTVGRYISGHVSNFSSSRLQLSHGPQ